MKIPTKHVGDWAQEIIDRCSASRGERLQRGAMYRNLYLTGDENGDTATYNKSYAFINNLSSYLYSPVELRYSIEHFGPVDAILRAKTHAATYEMSKYIKRGNLDTSLQDAVTWSLVKGKTFIKLLWTKNGFEPTLIQPELVAVLREDLNDLNEQDAFCHRTYLTPERFREMVQNHPDRDDLLTKIRSYISVDKSETSPERQNQLKQVILGGLNPYQVSGGQRRANKGVVNWLDGPYPNLAPEVVHRLIPLDELWVWDEDRDDYTVIQQVAPDIILEGKDRHRNLIADPYDPTNREMSPKSSDMNPLARRHPFIEICPNRLDGYFWGRSELVNVALLQKAINNRMDGINGLLRRQEDPPKFYKGTQTVTAKMHSALKKPGGMLTDASPNAAVEELAPKLPPDLFASLSQFNEMFNDMAGFAPILSGHGEVGVRSQAQAEELVKNATPRFKTRALLVERQVENAGELAFNYLKAKIPYQITAWVDNEDAGPFAGIEDKAQTPPIKNTKSVAFLLGQMPSTSKVVVDSHSSSPAFSGEVRQMMYDLATAGVIKPERLVEHLHPPGQDEIIEDIRQADAEKAEFIAQHPELYMKELTGKRSR